MNELKNFTRLFKNVKNCKELNWQEKAILSEIISYQLDKNPFKHKDLTLSIELGMDKGTISKLINRLYKKGVINKVTVSFASLSGGKPKRQRTVTVNEIDKWVSGKTAPTINKLESKNVKAIIEKVETLGGATAETIVTPSIENNHIEPEVKPLIKPKKNSKEPSLEQILSEVELKSKEKSTSTQKKPSKVNSVITLDAEKDVDNTPDSGKIILAMIKQEKEIDFVKVQVNFGDELISDEATLVPNGSNKYFLKSTLKVMNKNVFV